MKTENNKNHLEAKQKTLKELQLQLKSKFIGLDHVIDSLCSKITSWYLFPDKQSRPVIINLWGLTGTGKTALVRELVAFLNLDNHYIHYDFSSDRHSFRWTEKLRERLMGTENKTFVICFDEIQHLRSVDEEGKENRSQHEIWNLLDKGKVEISGNYHSYSKVYELYFLLNKVRLHPEVQVKEGMVVKGKIVYNQLMGFALLDNEDDINSAPEFLVPEFYHEHLLALSPELEDHYHLRNKLSSLNKNESVDLLKKILDNGVPRETLDCRSGLIFIAGNIDEAYPMAHSMEGDLDADFLHEQTKQLNITQIKKALARRFRPEQIARLGNNHLWYYAFNRKQYQDLIKLKLEEVTAEIKAAWSLPVEYEPLVEELLYLEGVVPSQGTRPLWSTIQAVVESPLKEALAEVKIHEPQADRLKVQIEPQKEELLIKVFHEHRVIRQIRKPVFLDIYRVMHQRNFDDFESVLAVHEAGHSLAGVLYLGVLPQKISILNRGEQRAFARIQNERDFETKSSVSDRLKILLAGQAAERILFGKQEMSNGAAVDLDRATDLALTYLHHYGWGSKKGHFSLGPSLGPAFQDLGSDLQKEAQTWLKECYEEVEMNLSRHRQELLHLSRAIFKHGVLETQDLLNLPELNWPQLKSKCTYKGNHLAALLQSGPEEKPLNPQREEELRVQREEDRLLIFR